MSGSLPAGDHPGTDRVSSLDALRGVAILTVILFHLLARWPDYYPFADTYASFPLFKYGYLGVHLFFMISGYVILMSLERTDSFGQFLFRRWLRLFPAMLIATVLVLLTAGWLTGRPAGTPGLLSAIPGLLFVDPEHLALLGLEITPIEHAFWSLFVEVKFYILAGAVYHWRGPRALLVAMAVLSLGTKLVPTLVGHVAGPAAKEAAFFVLSHSLAGAYMPLFMLGALAYFRQRLARPEALVLLACAAAALFLSYRQHTIDLLLLAGVAVFFWVAVTWRPAASIVSNRVLLFFGFVSYPLYLIHENAGVALLGMLGKTAGAASLPALALPALAAAPLVLVAWIMARWAEPALRGGLSRLFKGGPHPARRAG